MNAIVKPDDLRRALLAWYKGAHRDLPWRHTRDPYAIWVSEVMLQQTQVSTVIPYYGRFLERFATVADLARASLDEVLALWQGLGYYGRARNLHRAAHLVCQQYQGNLPADLDALRRLPGIGAYTAGAILSIAYGQPVPALDANAVRVLARLLDLAELPALAKPKRQLEATARSLLPSDDPGRLNQALMELGALVCAAATPLCARCPWHADCLARLRGTVLERPIRRERRPVPQRLFVGACILHGAAILLCRREPHGLLGGLWEIPSLEVSAKAQGEDALHTLLAQLGLTPASLDPQGLVRHAYSHFGVRLHLYSGQAFGRPEAVPPWDRCAWVSLAEMDRFGLTGVTRKSLDIIAKKNPAPE